MASSPSAPAEPLAYPRGIRLVAAILGFIAATRLFGSISTLVDGIALGDGIRLASGLFFVTYFVLLLAVAVGIFWFKEWARFVGVGLMAVAAVLAFGVMLVFRSGLGVVSGLFTLAAAVAVLYYLTRPHVKAWFAYAR